MNAVKKSNLVALLGVLLLAIAFVLTSAPARSEVVRHGQWPEKEYVSLSLSSSPRNEAVQQLAKVAGWGLVAEGLDATSVSVDVRDQPAENVLSLLLADGDYEVTRDGNLVSIRSRWPVSRNAAKNIQTPTGAGEDLFVTNNAYVGKDHVVRDVFVLGNVVVEGTVTGSVVLFGGNARLVRGARVGKDVIAFGGSVDIDEGVEVGGDVAALFGAMRRGAPNQDATRGEPNAEWWPAFFAEVFENLTRSVIAWLFGALLLAIAAPRLNLLREEVERRPLRNLGVGFLTLLGAVMLLIILVFTLIGIPLAVLLAIVGAVVTYLAVSAVPLAVGRRITSHRSDNPYVHLAIGCGVVFVVVSIPVIGTLFSLLGTFVTVGALFSTRLAGLLKRSSGSHGV